MTNRNKYLLYLSGYTDGLTDITHGEFFYVCQKLSPKFAARHLCLSGFG
jgi:hypothetical protein